MKEKICFILNGKQVFMDECLVEDEIPVFFTCIDEDNKYYIALCADMDELRYCVVQVSVVQLHNMLRGKISMREIFIIQRNFWEVIPTDGKTENDMVEYKGIEQINQEDLPDEGARFQLYSLEVRKYADKIGRELIKGFFESFPVRTNDALQGVAEGKEFHVSIRLKDVISARVEVYGEYKRVECTAKWKEPELQAAKYGKEEDWGQISEQSAVAVEYLGEEKILVGAAADTASLLFAA